MDNNGFDDIEMNNRNREEHETGETSGGNFADTNLDTGETTRLLPPTSQTDQNEVRVENPNSRNENFLRQSRRNLGGIKRSITSDKKKLSKMCLISFPKRKMGKIIRYC